MAFLWLLAAIFIGLPMASFAIVVRGRQRLEEIDRRARRSEDALRAIDQRLAALERAGGMSAIPAPAEGRPAAETESPASAPPPPARPTAVPSPPPVPPPPVVPPLHPVAGEAHPPPLRPVPGTVPQAPAPTAGRSPEPMPELGGHGGGGAPPAGVFPGSQIDWEGLVGVKLFSWIAGVALVFAAIFFLRYSIEHGWLSPPVRMAIGLATGGGLLIFCELRAARRYPVTTNALDAAGIAILFSTLFAAHALWHLLPPLPVFVLMTLVTAVAVLLSIRRDSVFIALLGLVGGFATPALLSTGQDRPIALFSYLLLINSGLAWVAFRKQWPLLTLLSVVCTALYEWAWVMKFLDASRLSLAMSIFVVFPVLHASVAALHARDKTDESVDRLFGQAVTLASLIPVIFAIFLSAVPAYGDHYALLFSFLFLVVVGLAVIAATRGLEILHLLGGLSTLSAFAMWFALSYRHSAWPSVLIFLAAFVMFFLGVPALARRLGRPLAYAGEVMLVAPLLLFAFPVLVVIEPATAEPGLLFGTLFVLLIVVATASIIAETGSLHILSAFFALATEAVWSVKHLTPERLLPALTMYAAFGLFYLAVPIVAERRGKRLLPEGSGAVALVVSLGLVFFLTTGSMAHAALWGIALLLAVLNLGLLFEASAGRLPWLSLVGVALSWFAIAVWWAHAMMAAVLIPCLTVVAGFALLILAGGVWARNRAAGSPAAMDTAAALDRTLSLSLTAHLFLLFVAQQRALAIPPWPLLSIVGVLDLAIGTVALYTRSGTLHVAALAASQLILMLWIVVARTAPWPLVGTLAAALVVAFALTWIALARRRGAAAAAFAAGVISSAVLGEVMAIIAVELPGAPDLPWLLSVHVALLVALLLAVGLMQWHVVAVWAIVPPALATTLWINAHVGPTTWINGILFAAALYAVFLGYPVALGRRAGRARDPYLAAVVAGVPFFFLARHCIIAGGFGNLIGALPVVQAFLMLGLLVQLLRLEQPGQRQLGRLALVAGAALAFVTVAIPLQLEREWVTIGWAIEGAALAWLYRRIPHRGLLAWSAGLCAVVVARLCLNPAILEYHPRGATPIWNWYLYTYLVTAAALFAAARLLRDTNDRIDDNVRVSDILPAGGTLLLFLLLNIEIADYFSTGPTLTFNFSAGLAQDLTYTLCWALFAIGLLTTGIAGQRRAARIAALGLLVVTVVKCFLHDLWRLGGLYRVGSFVGLAICLALVAVLLQRFVLGEQREAT